MLNGGPYSGRQPFSGTTTMHTDMIRMPINAQPDPDTHPEFYADVVAKRFLAWVVDVLLIAGLTFIFTLFSLLTAVLILPLVFAVIGFLYRWVTLTGRSATPGMRLLSIEFLRPDGDGFDGGTAFLHTAGYYVSVAVFPLQLISIAMMLISRRKQGLTDHILGTVAVNRRA
jgi:uncharacterized RDD family membrane protein YckC